MSKFHKSLRPTIALLFLAIIATFVFAEPWNDGFRLLKIRAAIANSLFELQSSACSQTRHENIQQNARHYLPGETVLITGVGFAPNCEVTMRANVPNDSSSSGTATTDASGTLSYSYILGDVTGDYSIQAVIPNGTSLAMTLFSSGIYVTTDKTDYLPGETVNFSGRGFAPGETINLAVHQQYPGGIPVRSFSSVADDTGAFVNTSLVVNEQDRHTTLRVIATGQSSSRSTESVFTDAAASFVIGSKVVNATTGTTTVSSITAAYPALTPTAGNLLVAIVGAFGNGTAITAPSGWSTAINQPGTLTAPAQGIFYKISAGVADNSVTAGFTPNATGTISIQQFSNILASSDPFDGNSSSTGTTSPANTGTVVPLSGATTALLIGAISGASATADLTMTAGNFTNGFAGESPVGEVRTTGTAPQLQRVTSQSVNRKNSTANNSTGVAVGGGMLGWRGQIAAFKTKLDTTTTLTTSPVSPSVFSQPVTLTATISNPAATGAVVFTRGAFNCVAPVSAGQAQCVTSSLALGTANITATYSGDATYASSAVTSSFTVNRANTAASTPTSSYNPSPFGQSVTFSTTITAVSPATVDPADGVGDVTFRNGGTAITGCAAVEISGGVATCTTTLPAGTHSITAEFNLGGNYNDSAVSSPLSQQVVAQAAGPGCNLVVDKTGGTPGSYLTIQEAVNGLPNPGPCTVTVLSGTYNESVEVDGTPANNNNDLATLESQRIIIRADPAAAPGSVIVTPAGLGGTSAHHAFNFAGARFMTLRGFAVTGAEQEGILLQAGSNSNSDMVIDSNDVYNNGSTSVSGGIGIGGTNPRTWIINNLSRNNGRNGLAFGVNGASGAGNPKYVVNNTFYANGWNGLTTPSAEDLYLVNNLFVGNGTQPDPQTGGRNGINGTSIAIPTTKILRNNMFFNNRGGDIDDPTFWFEPASVTDSGNRTTFGTEGAPGVASPTAGCTFSDCLALHNYNEIFVSPGTDFRLRTAGPISPAIDSGVNSYVAISERVPGLDFEGSPRPTDGNSDSVATVDVGYAETPAVVSNATLTVIKSMVNDNGGSAVAANWTLTVSSSNGGTGTGNAPGSETGTVYTLQSGKAYSVAESGGPSGYAATSSADCDIASVVAGSSYTCTITNDDIQPKLTVIKHVINDNGGTLTAANFTMNVTGTNASPSSFSGAESPGTLVAIDAGSYSVDEATVAGYAKTLGTDCSGTLAVGDEKTCTITNDDIQPKLTVIKHVINDNGGTLTASNFTMNVTGTNATPSSFAGAESPGTLVALDAGSYSVDETSVSGYAKTIGADCSGTLAVGDEKSCTITNDDIPPTITVTKALSPSSDPGRFNLRIDGVIYATNVGDAGTTGAQIVLANSTHTVDETGGTVPPTSLANYTSMINCGGGPMAGSSASFSLSPGQNVTCVITNTIIDTDGDGIPDFLDCAPSLFTDRVVDPAGTLSAYLPVNRRHATLQAAVIAAADDDVIAMIANTTENVIIGDTTGSGGKDLRIVGCGKKITGALLTKPVVTVEMSAGINDGNTGEGEADIHIDDLDVTKGSIGYLIQTSKGTGNSTDTLLKSIRSDANTGGGLGIGIRIQGNGNEVRGANSVGSNTPGDGIQVIGDNNLLRSNRVLSNKGDGIEVTGNSNSIVSNPIGDKSKGNKANGINVIGSGNNVEENDVYASTLLGIRVTGNSNDVSKNDVGEKDKANLGGGILIAGNGTSINENNIYSNTGVGLQVNGDMNQITTNDIGAQGKGNTLDGVRVVGAGNILTENDSFANGFSSGGTPNGGDGFDVSGGTAASPNVLFKNRSGAAGAGNGGHGFLLAGAGNGIALPIEVDENTAKANKLNGFKVTGSGWQLGKNVSGGSAGGSDDNVKWEFEVVLGNFNATGNKANGSTIAGAMNSAFPTTGQGTP